MKKEDEYTQKIMAHLGELFDDESDCENHIDINEFQEGDNMTDFTHAISTLVPAIIINKFTGNEFNILQFNHMANTLIMQSIKNIKN